MKSLCPHSAEQNQSGEMRAIMIPLLCCRSLMVQLIFLHVTPTLGSAGEPMSWFMPGSCAIEGLRVTGGIQYSISLNKWCSLGLFIARPEWEKWWRIGFLYRASFLIQMKSQEVHSSHFGDNEVVKLLVLCGHQERHLCTGRVLCLLRPGWHRHVIIVVLSLHAKPSLGKSWRAYFLETASSITFTTQYFKGLWITFMAEPVSNCFSN